MPAYADVYLDEIVETQGNLFEDVLEFSPNIDVANFVTSYMTSEVREHIDRADPYVCTRDAVELWELFCKTEKFMPKIGAPIGGFIPNWIGQFYAYFQWLYAVPSAHLLALLPISDMCRMYGGLHDLDLELAVKKIGEELIHHGMLSQPE